MSGELFYGTDVAIGGLGRGSRLRMSFEVGVGGKVELCVSCLGGFWRRAEPFGGQRRMGGVWRTWTYTKVRRNHHLRFRIRTAEKVCLATKDMGDHKKKFKWGEVTEEKGRFGV